MFNSPLTRWCHIEALNEIYQKVQSTNRSDFVKWNENAKLNLELVNDFINKHFYDIEDEWIKLWVQSILMGALAEFHYNQISEFSFFDNIIKIFELGLFPCGFRVDSPSDFPNNVYIYICTGYARKIQTS